jgi:tRNA threonylcarbamoyladenosine biosynthesis protein TsaE
MSPLEFEFDLPDAEATVALGEALGQRLPSGAVLALEGELGAGKTTLVRGLASGLGIPGDEVSSPTYTLMHQHSGRLELLHFDAWMAAREGALLSAGGREWLESQGVAAIEWASKVAAFLPRPRLELGLEPTRLGGRRARLTLIEAPPGAGPAQLELEARLRAVLGADLPGKRPAGAPPDPAAPLGRPGAPGEPGEPTAEDPAQAGGR